MTGKRRLSLPFIKKDTNLIENVQIRATKYVDWFKDLDYPDRLRTLELPTLMYRRARGDILLSTML